MGKIRRIQRAPAPTPDFQVEAEEDIKSETSGALRDLLLALAKVRRTYLQRKAVIHTIWEGCGTEWGVLFGCNGQERALWGGPGLNCWPEDKKLPAPQRVLLREFLLLGGP